MVLGCFLFFYFISLPMKNVKLMQHRFLNILSFTLSQTLAFNYIRSGCLIKNSKVNCQNYSPPLSSKQNTKLSLGTPFLEKKSGSAHDSAWTRADLWYAIHIHFRECLKEKYFGVWVEWPGVSNMLNNLQF